MILIALAVASLAAPLEPAKTWVFAVSCTRFKNTALHDLPPEGRQETAFVNAFQERGVPGSRVTLLRDQEADTKRVDFEFRQALRRVKPDGTLVVFYAGHGYFVKKGLFLATYNAEVGYPGWQMSRAASLVRKLFKGKRLVWIVDSCAGGALCEDLAPLKVPCLLISSAQGAEDTPEGWQFERAVVGAVKAGATDWGAVAQAALDGWPGASVWASP